jgi:hypothetical protein
MVAHRFAGPIWACVLGFCVAGCADQALHPGSDVEAETLTLACEVWPLDSDGDGVADDSDNCPGFVNADQARSAAFGPGDACRLSLTTSVGLLGRFARFQSHKELMTRAAPMTLGLGPDLLRVDATGLLSATPYYSPLTQRLGVRSALELTFGDAETLKPGEALMIGLGHAAELGGASARALWLRLDGAAQLNITYFRGGAQLGQETRGHLGLAGERFVAPAGQAFDRVSLQVTRGLAALRGPGELVVFTLAGAEQACPPGTRAVAGVCEDIDECAGLNRACDPLASCVNIQGSYACGPCPAGYAGSGNTGCIDRDECADGSADCSPLVPCSNTLGGYACGACPAGYRGDGRRCDDVEECAEGSAKCDARTPCTNLPGSYRCGTCPSGYTGDGASGCKDIDECAARPGVCDALSACTNRDGGYTCAACPTGYRGTGETSCVDVDECADGTAACSPLVICANTAGDYSCGPCPHGYAGDGRTCTDVDECSAGTPDCSALAVCRNTEGGYECGSCPGGYSGDGRTCHDVDECLSRPCDALVECTNTLGSFQCGACPAGYTGDGYLGCIDVDECAFDNGGCAATEGCRNLPGTRACLPCGGRPLSERDTHCDGVDEDCDGAIDEDFMPRAAACGSAACAGMGQVRCVAGAEVTECSLPPVGTLCDDGNACNGRDACQGDGQCLALAPEVALCCPGGVAQDSLAGTGLSLAPGAGFPSVVQALLIGPYASQHGSIAAAFPDATVTAVHGRVVNANGEAVSCATIAQPAAPTLGSTLSRADGSFVFVTNAGSAAIQISAPGFAPANVNLRLKEQRVTELGDVRIRP